MIRDLKEIKNIIIHKKSLFFYLWCMVIFYVFTHIWKYIITVIIILTLYISTFILIKKTVIININKNSSLSVLWAYFKLNIINLYKHKTFNVYILLDIIMKLVFRHVMGFSVKMLKCSIKYAIIVQDEFITAKISKKRISITIYKTFFKNTINMLIFEEFSKPTELNKKEIIKVLGIKKNVYVNIWE